MVKIKGSSSASGSKMSLQVLMICKVFLANGGWAQIFEPEKFEKKKKISLRHHSKNGFVEIDVKNGILIA